MEQVGGAVLMSLPPATMANGALAAVEARLNEPVGPPSEDDTDGARAEVPGFPKFVRRYQFGIGNGLRPPSICGASCCPMPAIRGFFCSVRPWDKDAGARTYRFEMTCVLSGAFSQGGAHFGPGDFDLGDETVGDHEPVVDSGQDCVCLVAMQGGLRLNGLLGRIIQPFVRL